MTDHIVVFDGAERLIGRTVRVAIDDASSFTLYGRAETAEVAGADLACDREPAPRRDRFTLPLV